MNLKSVLLAIFIGCTLSAIAQDGCVCPAIYDPVCAQDSVGNFREFPNACEAECKGFNVVSDTTLCKNVSSECVCIEIYQPVCGLDSLGNYIKAPNSCFAECWGLTIVTDSTLCNTNPWDKCDCEINQDGAFVCAQDSIGNIWSLPNMCIAQCLGLVVITDYIFCDTISEGCVCPAIYDPVCAQDSLGNFREFPNACEAECAGFKVLEDQAFCDFVGSSCICPKIYDPVCGVDSLGQYVQAPNRCFAECWGLTIVTDLTLCVYDPWDDCDCAITENDSFICAVDSLGNSSFVPNACFAKCWGLTVLLESDCEMIIIEPEIDTTILSCLAMIDITESTTFQDALLMISEACDVALPDCILKAPIFQTDSAFIMYIIQNCGGQFGFNGNHSGSNIFNVYNIINNRSLSGVENTPQPDKTKLYIATNPVYQYLQYTITSPINTIAQISLTNINGEIIFRDVISINTGNQTFQKDIFDINSGMYLLTMTSGSQHQTKKIVVNH